MIHVYIAGPFGAASSELIEANIVAAEAVAAEIIDRGEDRFVTLCPHSLGRAFINGPGTSKYWYAATLSHLKRCDVMCLAPNWRTSHGVTQIEMPWCAEAGVPVFDDVDALLRFFKARKWAPPRRRVVEGSRILGGK